MATQNKVVAFPKGRTVREPMAWFCRLGTNGHNELATLQHPLKHSVKQTLTALSDLHVIPDDHRAAHYVTQVLAKSARQAHRVAALRPNDEKATELGVDSTKLMKALKTHSETLDRRHHVLEQLVESTDTAGHRSKPVNARHGGDRDDSSAQSGVQQR